MSGKSKRSIIKYFSPGELALWCSSMALIILSYAVFDRDSVLALIASLIGVTSLIFCAKGNPAGQLLMIIFSLLYGYISWTFSYYGEMATYLGMTAPMALFALISWLRNPYDGNRAQVRVSRMTRRDVWVTVGLAVPVTVAFYFILRALGTANLIPGTISVTTSFFGVWLTYKRSPWFALAYAANDLVLIVLWVLAAMEDSSYVSVVTCFIVFSVNDVYGFISWVNMEKRQREGA